MSSAVVRPPWVAWLYTHNPFYAISVMLMLYGVLAGYGEMKIGSINNWIMIGTLATYTVLLAGITVAIVRWGKVWDDARSLFALLLLLFLAVSISVDELFVRESTVSLGLTIITGGWFMAAMLSELVLRGTRVRLPWGIRGPYHLLLVLFYFWPALCSTEVLPNSPEKVEAMIFFFPTAASLLFLLLLPAVRCGKAYTKNNGTPYPWPWFPWTMFAFIAGAVMIRSYILCLTFGPTGSIWKEASESLGDINYDSIFGFYFFIPLVFVMLLLVQEAAIIARNQTVQKLCLAGVPLLLLLAIPFPLTEISNVFLNRFVIACGTPLWIAIILSFLLLTRAWVAQVPLAGVAVSGILLLFCVVGKETLDLNSLHAPHAWPLVLVSLIAFVHAIRQRSSAFIMAGCLLLTAATWFALPETVAAGPRFVICIHLMWLACLGIGFLFEDACAEMLRFYAAIFIPVAGLLATVFGSGGPVPMMYSMAYILSIATVALFIGLWRERMFLYAFGGVATFMAYEVLAVGYYQGIDLIGRSAMISLSWSVGFLMIAVLISARKANWLPADTIARTLFGEHTSLRS